MVYTGGMNEYMQPNEWDDPDNLEIVIGDGGRLAKRASVLIWVIAGLELLMGGCLACAFGAIVLTPTDQIIQQAQGQFTLDQISEIKDKAPAITIGVVILTVVPAVCYLVLGFFIRRGNKVSIWIAAILTLAQTIILGLMTVFVVINTLMIADLISVTMVLILYGTPVVVLGYTTWVLVKCGMDKVGNFDGFDDQWD